VTLAEGSDLSYMTRNGDVDAPKELRRRDDHEIARQRRMYARLLFVVVGIFGVGSPFFPGDPSADPELRLGTVGGGGYTLAYE